MRVRQGREERASRPAWQATVFELALVALPGLPGAAQTQGWTPDFGGPGVGTSRTFGVSALAVFDDGSGPQVYAGGDFDWADGRPAHKIAVLENGQWVDVLGGIDEGFGRVLALEARDDGNGPALFVGGEFATAGGRTANGIACWDGTRWTVFGALGARGIGGLADASVSAIDVFDDGSGPAMYVAGSFLTAGGQPASNIARWDGTGWTALGTGTDGPVEALAVFDDGTGPALYAGGSFDSAGGLPGTENIARWRASGWEAAGAGLPSLVSQTGVRDLRGFDDGSGAKLYAAGAFALPGGFKRAVFAWDGSTWASLGPGPSVGATGLGVFDDGSGEALYVCGGFASMGGVVAPDLARWDGNAWAAAGPGVIGGLEVLESYDDGSGPLLLAGGSFLSTDEQSPRAMLKVAAWDGLSLNPVGGEASGMLGPVTALGVFDDGSGPALYAGGDFEAANNVPVEGVARWTGSTWEPLGPGLGMKRGVDAFAVFDDGSGPALHAGGRFKMSGTTSLPYVARWDGQVWSGLGLGVSNRVKDLAVHDDGTGSALYAAGWFTSAGTVPALGIARWDGSAWSPLGAGLPGRVNALAVFDDGTGPALFAGGSFTMAGGAPALHVARWNGQAWSALGAGVNGVVLALKTFDDGSGEALYVGGKFRMAGGVTVEGVARWDGSNWSGLAGGLKRASSDEVATLEVFDDGGGASLLAGGEFFLSTPRSNVARWDGTSWLPLDRGVDGRVEALMAFDEGSGPSLFAGGGFRQAGRRSSLAIARWSSSCDQPPETFCTSGPSSNGCRSSLSAIGLARRSRDSGFQLEAVQVEGVRNGILFFGTASRIRPWGMGQMCVAGPWTRTGVLSSGGTSGACDGRLTLDLNTWMWTNPAKAPDAGTTIYAQAWFRDPGTARGGSLSDGLKFAICP